MIDDIDRVCHETAGYFLSDGPIRWSYPMVLSDGPSDSPSDV